MAVQKILLAQNTKMNKNKKPRGCDGSYSFSSSSLKHPPQRSSSSYHPRGAFSSFTVSSSSTMYAFLLFASFVVLAAPLASASASVVAAGAAATTVNDVGGGGGAGASRFLFQAAAAPGTTISTDPRAALASDALVPAGGVVTTCDVGVHECSADKFLTKVGRGVVVSLSRVARRGGHYYS